MTQKGRQQMPMTPKTIYIALASPAPMKNGHHATNPKGHQCRRLRYAEGIAGPNSWDG